MQARDFNGYSEYILSSKRRTLVGTTRPIWEELFASLEYYSEVEEVGCKLFSGKNGRKNFFLFQSFIRQSKSYYESAVNLHYRASALNYYYSFMNLVKAYILVNNPAFFSKNYIKHGLNFNFKNRPFKDQTIHVDSRGIFREFYRIYTGNDCPKIFLNVSNLLSYSTDISWEYLESGYGKPKSHVGKAAIVTQDATRKAWPIFIIDGFSDIVKYKTAAKLIMENFEKVDLDKARFSKVFEIEPMQQPYFSVIQSKKEYDFIGTNSIPTFEIIRDFENIFKDYYLSNLYREEWDFYLQEPLRRNFQIPFSEPLAIYSSMYFFCSLVRYQPQFLETLLSTKELWLIEQFIKSSPVTFLKHMASLILGRELIYYSR